MGELAASNALFCVLQTKNGSPSEAQVFTLFQRESSALIANRLVDWVKCGHSRVRHPFGETVGAALHPTLLSPVAFASGLTEVPA